MYDSGWDRPGIIPGLLKNLHQRQIPAGKKSSGLFGYIADPYDPKTPPGIGEQVLDINSQYNNTEQEKALSITAKVPEMMAHSPQVGDLLIRGGKIKDAEDTCNVDILIIGGKIKMSKLSLFNPDGVSCNSEKFLHVVGPTMQNFQRWAIGGDLKNGKNIQEIDATNLVISSGLVDFSATSHAFSSKLEAEGMADPTLIREATSRAVLSGVTTIVDTVYSGDNYSPLSVVAAYLQALQSTYVYCNVAVRAGIRHLTVNTASEIELLARRHHIKSFLLAIPENDRILCEQGNPASTVLYGVLSTCRNLGIVPTIGLDRITGSQIPQMEGDSDLRLASVAITIAKLSGCPIILSPIRSLATMHKIYTAQREHPSLSIYSDFAIGAIIGNSLKEQAPYVAADSNIIISSGECFTLPGELGTTKTSWVQEAHREILKQGWANECHIIGTSCKKPAQLTGLFPQKGQLTIGADADLVLWAEGDRSKPVFTVVGGRIAVQYGQLRDTVLHDQEGDNTNRVGFVRSGETPCAMLVALHETMKEIGKATQSPQPPHEAEVINKPENKSGDVAPAGLPSRTMRSIASQYKRESLTSNFKLTGEQKDDDRPIKPNIRIWQNKSDSPRPY